ncbi:MAG: hypothetical protein FJ197_05735 [Gammaproteobacteria bacterium]|nr:hypothetical protein [Gammaproteobacteria bacterium]
MTLRLIRHPEGFAAASFGFPAGERALRALMEVARLNVVSQNFWLDPRQQKTALTRMELASAVEAALLSKVLEHPANPEGRALVHEIKYRIGELCVKNGASHMQVGKDYPYLQTPFRLSCAPLQAA